MLKLSFGKSEKKNEKMKLTNVNELASLVIFYKNVPTYIDKNECLSFVSFQNTVLLLWPRGKHLHTRWSKIALAMEIVVVGEAA